MTTHVNRWCIWCIFLSVLLHYATVLVGLWFTSKVLMECFSRGIHWGVATQCVILDLGNGFTEIISLTWHWMCNLWVSNRSEISWPCIINAAEIEHGFFLLQRRWHSWYTVRMRQYECGEGSTYYWLLSTVLLPMPILFYIVWWPSLDFYSIPYVWQTTYGQYVLMHVWRGESKKHFIIVLLQQIGLSGQVRTTIWGLL